MARPSPVDDMIAQALDTFDDALDRVLALAEQRAKEWRAKEVNDDDNR